jgi:hypothetical protein
MKSGIRRSVACLAIAVFAAATLVGPAWSIRPDDRAGLLGVGAISSDTSDGPVRPDDRGTARGPGPLSAESRAAAAVSSAAIRPDDRAGVRLPGPGSVVAQAPLAGSPDYGFRWMEAGIGAAFLALVGLVGAALVWNVRYHRRPV